MHLDSKQQWEILNIGLEKSIGVESILSRIDEGKRLKIKLGVDPTRPDLTFGHMVVFNKLRQFQDLGHEVILLIGDYTAQIGDPSGRSITRPSLTEEDVKKNAATYLDQVFKILDKKQTTVRRNSEWFSKQSFLDVLNLAKKITVAQLIERDDFSKRFKEGKPISLVEFLYPLMQGYDSVMLESDVEIGGSDQLFNMLVGRSLQREFGKSEQAVLCLPLLVGLDGVRKMSKSYDNYISFNDNSKDMFGKIMSVSDEGMWEYFRLLLMESDEKISKRKSEHPMLMKKDLACILVEKFYSKATAENELKQFEEVFSKGKMPEEMPIFNADELNLAKLTLLEIINATQISKSSKKEIRRVISQGGVKINGEKIIDPLFEINNNTETTIQFGKRTFFKLM